MRVAEEFRDDAIWPSDAPPFPPIRWTPGSPLELEVADRVVAVHHQGEVLGALSLSKRPGESLTPTEDKLVSDLAAQAGLVLRNVGLTEQLIARLEDLRASRQRLVSAQDQERRRIERNIHDGAQQQLVALAVKLNLAESLVGRDEDKERALVVQLKAEAQDALENLRDLARGIYPPLLADQGLGAALGAQARRAAIPVTVDADGIGRYPQEVEAAAYFCCLEALQNVAKYSRASHTVIRLSGDERHVGFSVEDDGAGFDVDVAPRGSGLTNMDDRISALGNPRGSIVSGRGHDDRWIDPGPSLKPLTKHLNAHGDPPRPPVSPYDPWRPRKPSTGQPYYQRI